MDIIALFPMDLSQHNLERALQLLGNLLTARRTDAFWLVRALAPNSTEIEAAVRWVLDFIPVLAHRDKLPDLLIHLGHAHLIPTFKR